jgi:methionyl aminopeptidase
MTTGPFGIHVKSSDELGQMAQAGRIVATVLDAVESQVAPGVSTWRLDQIAREVLGRFDARSAFEGYPHDRGGRPFPGVLCTSVNEAVVHGIPSEETVLRDGDIISVDFGCEYGGYFGDSARTIAVGAIGEDLKQLVDVTRRALEAGIAACQVGAHLLAISAAIEEAIRSSGMGLVKAFVGHGIGRELHEEPGVPNFVPPGHRIEDSPRLEAGMVLAIEPMVNLGTAHVRRLPDGWTVVTGDGRPSAHFEHTVAITEDGPIVLTSTS